MPDENELAMHTASFIVDATKDFAPLYEDKDWLLIATTNAMPFMVSDNPIAFQNSYGRIGPYGNIGLAVRGIEIYCPLSPTRGIAMWCRSLIGEIRNVTAAVLRPEHCKPLAPLAKALIEAVDGGKALPYVPDNVMNFNSLQIAHAERYVFSKDGNFDLAREMISKDQSLRGGPRMQIA